MNEHHIDRVLDWALPLGGFVVVFVLLAYALREWMVSVLVGLVASALKTFFMLVLAAVFVVCD